MSPINSLPDEILQKIISYIHITEKFAIRSVSKKFKTVVDLELSSTRSFQLLGKSIRSMLDFVTDAKKKEIRCDEHHVLGIDTIRTIGKFEEISRTISNHLNHLRYLRLHKMTLTWNGFKVMTNSTFWNESLQHLDIKSCYLESQISDKSVSISDKSVSIIDRREVFEMKKPPFLIHFNLILMSEQDDLFFILQHLTRDLRTKHEERSKERTKERNEKGTKERTEKGTIFNIQTPTSKLSGLIGN